SGEVKPPVTIRREDLEDWLGVARYRYGEAEAEDQVGVVTGLAWTETGGELLQIEAAITPGRGKLTITGHLGEVMQESAHAAFTYVRARAEALGLERDFYRRVDVHVHVPEGAIPKDGPSAGIAMATAIASALTKIPVKRQVCMTGEITLRGKVLPIGGLKEKLLAAQRGGLRDVLIPEENMPELREMEPEALEGLEIHPVRHMDEVLRLALVRLPEGFAEGKV
ncbi:MAG: endopeptidase La, partial [Zetaproteobacteria bacterium]